MSQLTVSVNVKAPIQKVWQYYNFPEHIPHWNFASDDWECPSASGDFKVGGVFTSRMQAKDGSFGFDFSGQYSKIEEYKTIAYTLGEMKEFFLPAGRNVETTFEETPQGVKITSVFDAEEIHSQEQQIQGWTAILENFKRYVESN